MARRPLVTRRWHVRIAARGEGVGGGVADEIDLRHRHAGGDGHFLDDVEQFGIVRMLNRRGPADGQDQLIALIVGQQRQQERNGRRDEADRQAAPPVDSAVCGRTEHRVNGHRKGHGDDEREQDHAAHKQRRFLLVLGNQVAKGGGHGCILVTLSEFHLGRLAHRGGLGGVELEELGRAKAEHAADHVAAMPYSNTELNQAR